MAIRTVESLYHGLKVFVLGFLLLLFIGAHDANAQSMPPPEEPSKTSTVGMEVTNPVTGETTTVTTLYVDPPSAPTDGDTAFVETADGYVFLVKDVGELFYNNDSPPLAFTIESISGTTAQVTSPSATGETPFETQQTKVSFDADFNSSDEEGELTPPETVNAATGVSRVLYGRNGSNGRDGALVVPPKAGGKGDDGPLNETSLSSDINATGRAGWIVGSIGGNGGQGGDSYLSFWDGADGGNGGRGGTVRATQNASSDIVTSGTNNDGIFAVSRSGRAGNGGSGFAAPGGGTGGKSSDGGSVTVNQNGNIATSGINADGVYALSVSNNGGNGGSQWGLVGGSGSAGFGGDGGSVRVNTGGTGSILTTGQFANGVLAQSIGGTGGSSGKSSNLLVSLVGKADNGGNGGAVRVDNAGRIETRGIYSRGIVAQSVGGGGGGGTSANGLVALSLGGVGSSGGVGGVVEVNNNGTGVIITQGTGSHGILAQSIGGSGGTAPNANGLVALGGNGGNAGNGNTVTVRNIGEIQTNGDQAVGIVAQSIGGGGGDGSSSAGVVAVGGSGGGGGQGNTVTIVNDGIITTRGDDAMGVLAQSVGGGGGNGGSAGSVGLFAGVAVGGKGGTGNNGGVANVTLSNTDASQPSQITTNGDRSTGVFIQSIGGGGGNGGGAVQATVGFGGAASVAVGGSGGAGGNGGTVTLQGSGDASVQTGGADSTGILLQSVGGGGGNGGYAVSVAVAAGPVSGALSVGVGGNGSGGGTGGAVSVGDLSNAGFSGVVITTGDRSTGMLFQSVGGGGGNGGLAVAGSGGASVLFSANVSVGIGGKGAGGGAGGTVTVNTASDITTTGTSSSGLVAQSIGGGGGNGGGSIAAGINASAGGAFGVNVGIGGAAGAGSNGGGVTLIASGDAIETRGMFSTGVLAQSVGGGGGNGGYSVAGSANFASAGAGAVNVSLGGEGGGGGIGGNVTGRVEAAVTTRSSDASAVVFQSVGGGGGNGGFSFAAGLAGAGGIAGNVDVGLGGDGNIGGRGGNVTGVRINGDVTTEGDRSSGVVVQSIGGGGGNGGFNVSAGVAGGGGGAGTIGIGLGGSGNGGGNGGVVEAQVAGTVTTSGTGSTGVVFQSIGGGGGNGGFNVSAGGAGAGLGGGAVTVGLGGDAGNGGNGLAVTGVTRDVTTSGDDATAVLAQSVGGGGGNGGFNVSASVAGAGKGSGAVSVGLGGNGGTGATAGTVILTSNGNVQTTGNRSSGLVAQSLGGGGGNGGFNVSGAGSGAGIGSGAVSVGLGGKGAGGGNAGQVTLTSNGTVLTTGDASTAFLAQSIGGGGGNGGFNISAAVSGAGVGSGSVGVGLGGEGDGGGDSMKVTGVSNDAVETRGNSSSGLVAQSIGGGGGNGGFNVSAGASVAGTGSGSVSVGLGGSGGGGGTGGEVDLTHNATILTRGTDSSAFVAQSIGGGGGNGGFDVSPSISGSGTGSAAVSVSLGGSGAGGGNGGKVTGLVTGAVQTLGDRSSGLVAQSIGGGGGNGGISVAAGLSAAGTGSGAVSVGLGGTGDTGGSGGDVTLTSRGSIVTLGADSGGFIAQSVGGGGGNGGFSVAPALSGAGTGSGAISVGLGGSGGGGGGGGTVIGVATQAVTTLGDRSSAVVAQSIGGGGGNGGFTVAPSVSGAGTGSGSVAVGLGGAGSVGANGGSVNLTTNGNIFTLGDDSSGFVAQSLGGGGGNGGFSVTAALSGAGTGAGGIGVGLGGSGDGGGNGLDVTGLATGNIETRGERSTGIVAQSIGGGGGNGGFNVSASIGAAGTGGGAASVGLGGSGGGGGDGGTVNMTANGTILTRGFSSAGFVAQSIGGGGGNGGFNVSGSVAGAGTGAGSLSVGLGGTGAGGGNGDQVTASTIGFVQTLGNASAGVLAQSVGGGGGNGGFNVSAALAGAGTGSGAVGVGLGGSGGSGGDGGMVGLTVVNDVSTFGNQSGAVIAQSIGGGGGNGGFNVSAAVGGAGTGSGAVGVGLGGNGTGGGAGDNVTSTVTGDLTTQGETSGGLLVQSVGGGGGNGGVNVSVAIAAAKSGAGGVSVGLGGGSGTGGMSGEVRSNFIGDVITAGADSSGVTVQSLGGGGGNGGVNVTANVTASTSGSGGAAVGLGGAGGGGGDADFVVSSVLGDVITNGDRSAGVMVQSAGGGGGNGGVNVSGALNFSGSGGGAIAVGIGGAGGGGGVGSDATGLVIGDVTTSGESAGGVVVQSIGGGGGNGGVNVSGTLNISKSGGGSAAIGVGGFGGDGGTSGTVIGTVIGDVTTAGDYSAGAVAQSLGGGGGNGGVNVSAAISLSNSFSGALGFGVGGFGGEGGTSNNVTHTVTGNIDTTGDQSIGILSQSLGGGGGNGGTNVTAALSLSRSNGGAMSLGVGGFGGAGADAGDLVTSIVRGGVTTRGDRSAGVVAQSLGGGGGNGGVNVSAAIGLTQENGGAIGLGMGGFGGGGGDGNAVISILNADTLASGDATMITTSGVDSTGVLAQSVGGGGGTGGVNVSAAVSLTGKSGAAAALGLGGFGGGGGDAGDVDLDVTSDVMTMGANADGLFAQSLGGGGGTGGVNISGTLAFTKPSGSDTIFGISAGVGGFGGAGGNASNVSLSFDGAVQAVPMTMSDGSLVVDESKGANAIVAQSIGGGGGSGGVNVSGSVAISNKPGAGQPDSSSSYGIVVGVGGFGGGGGNAGEVEVNLAAGSTVRAHGTGKNGILAQSIGGGGGNGGLNVSGGIVSDTSLIVGIGGFAGDGGTADDVNVSAVADIVVTTNPDDLELPDTTTFEDELKDFLGDTIGDPLFDEVESLAQSKGLERLFIDLGILSEEKPDTDGSAGLMAQSIGGGGGNGGLNVSGGIALSKDGKIPSLTFGIGGFGGAGNTPGDVNVDHTGTITVAGNWKHGLFAQSIGGGGGNGGLNVTGQLNYGDSNNSNGKTDMSIVAGLGGHGGIGANAGDVNVIQTGTIITQGYHARGLFAQSIGGGGGTGGINATFVATKDSSPIAIGVGGFGGGAGDAGSVTVNRGTATLSAGLIDTDGNGAHGIEASSIGGGGGDAGVNAVLGLSKTSGPDSNGGTGDSTDRKTPANTGVDPSVITNYNAVLDQLEGRTNPAPTDGSKKSGLGAVVAIGGDAGTAGSGGVVDVNHFGTVVTRQNGSHGVFAQSIGGGGGNAALNVGFLKQLGSAEKNKGFGLAIGGGTGDGGTGGNVALSNTGDVTTMGDDSHGLFAQSVGGGGGNAGYNFLSADGDGGKFTLQIGRVGGTGGSAGTVFASSDGIVATMGDRSHAIFAQSIGNGGGNSSTTKASLGTPKGDTASDSFNLAVGLDGGTGGAASTVTVEATGRAQTQGDNAFGIFAQSVGGGGGNGGGAKTSTGKGTSVSIGIGGTGGTGGIGGAVDVTSDAVVATLGEGAIGIAAQSIGGAGGTGGFADTGTSKFSIATNLVSAENIGTAVSLNIGGTGGDGMVSGTVDVDNAGAIGTAGDRAHGIFAQSIGGGGGMGGSVQNLVVNVRGTIGQNSTLSIGGDGGTGAASDAVNVTNAARIDTAGANAAGIYAQSVGGGGGDAQAVRNIVLGPSAENSATNAVLFGGSGGQAGTGANVTVENTSAAQIITDGAGSHGIFAQSIGGGGGAGGSTLSIDGRKGSEGTATRAIQFGLGGSGGTGGTGGNVDVTNAGTVMTSGAAAHGILAQSVGGGGGNGGSSITGTFRLGAATDGASPLQMNIGGSGGSGDVAGSVNVANSGDIQVDGLGSFGVLAQSVGGGGGNGGLAATMDITNIKDQLTGKSFTSLALGGFGGDGADAGDVTVTHTGTIVVNGDDAFGIFAQSVGGGGGNAGLSISNPVVSALDFALSQGLGARSGTDGQGGAVNVATNGTIVVNGNNSEAVLSQTINGGGGNVNTFVDFTGIDSAVQTARSSAGTGSVVTSEIGLGSSGLDGAAGAELTQSHSGDIATTGESNTGMLLQSIGGGGGNANTSMGVTAGDALEITGVLGAQNTNNSGGGAITGNRVGNLQTEGEFSYGGLAQSIGGGGGRLTLNGFSEGGAAENQVAELTFGADPSFSNDGGNVSMSSNGDVITVGDRSHGQVVQSIGAGGGESTVNGFGTAVLSFGAQDGSTGQGGSITYANIGDMTTRGEGSHGYVLQSIGGGGGLATTDVAESRMTLNLSDDNGGDGGEISFSTEGDTFATGKDATAVLAQSLGGGGGAVDNVFRGTANGNGVGGQIALSFDGGVASVGEGGIAVFAQSAGGNGGSDVQLNFLGDVIGGTGEAEEVAAVMVDTDANSQLTFGESSDLIAGNNQLIMATSGNDRVQFAGQAVGNLSLGEGNNLFNLREGATLYALDTLDMGADGLMTINGDLRLGRAASPTAQVSSEARPTEIYGINFDAQTAELTGELSFGSSAEYTADVAFMVAGDGGGLSDLINVSRDASIGGTLAPQLNRLERALPLVLIDSDGAVADAGTTIQDTIVLDYAIGLNGSTGDGSTIDLTMDVDFVVPGMTGNQEEVAGYFAAVLNGQGSAEMGQIFALIGNLTNEEDVIAAVDRYTAEPFAVNALEAFQGVRRFSDTLANCERLTADHLREDDPHRCAWLSGGNLTYDRDMTDNGADFSVEGTNLSGGFRNRVADDLYLGLAFGQENTRLESGPDYRASAERKNLGASLTRYVDDWEMGAMLTFGRTRYGGVRGDPITGTLPDGTEIDTGSSAIDQTVRHQNLRLSMAYRHALADQVSFLKPGLAVDAIRLQTSANGSAGISGANVQDTTQTFLQVSPSLEFGTKTDFSASHDFHAGVTMAAILSDTDEVFINAGVAGASPLDGGFRNVSEFDGRAGQLSVNFGWTAKDNSSYVNLQVDRTVGKRSDSVQMGVSLGFEF